MSTDVEVVRYVSSDVRCPACRQFRAELVITAAGVLQCAGCPALARMRRPRVRVRKGAAA